MWLRAAATSRQTISSTASASALIQSSACTKTIANDVVVTLCATPRPERDLSRRDRARDAEPRDHRRAACSRRRSSRVASSRSSAARSFSGTWPIDFATPARFWEFCVSLVGLHYSRFWRCFQDPHQPTQILTAHTNPQNRLIHRRIREVGLGETKQDACGTRDCFVSQEKNEPVDSEA